MLLIEHVGGTVVAGVMEHAKETGLSNPAFEVTVAVEVAD